MAWKCRKPVEVGDGIRVLYCDLPWGHDVKSDKNPKPTECEPQPPDTMNEAVRAYWARRPEARARKTGA